MTDMRMIVLRATVVGVLGTCWIVACSKNEEQPPPQQPGQYQQQPGQYPAQQPGQYPAQQPPATYPAAPPATGAPATGAPTSQPSAVAFPCQTDVQCLSHRCNVQVG